MGAGGVAAVSALGGSFGSVLPWGLLGVGEVVVVAGFFEPVFSSPSVAAVFAAPTPLAGGLVPCPARGVGPPCPARGAGPPGPLAAAPPVGLAGCLVDNGPVPFRTAGWEAAPLPAGAWTPSFPPPTALPGGCFEAVGPF